MRTVPAKYNGEASTIMCPRVQCVLGMIPRKVLDGRSHFEAHGRSPLVTKPKRKCPPVGGAHGKAATGQQW
jgi:hypothetical protein